MSHYHYCDGWIVGKNRPFYSNRYIYEGNTSVYIMAGDRPVVRLAEHRVLLGTLRLYIPEAENGADKPLEACSDVTFYYRPGEARWVVKDACFDGEILLETTSPGDGLGLIAKLTSPVPLRFQYGGLAIKQGLLGYGAHPQWNLSVKYSDRDLKTTRFCDTWLANNHAALDTDGKHVVLTDPSVKRTIHVYADGGCGADAAACEAVGTINTYFAACFENIDASSQAFEAGVRRSEALSGRFVVDTPDEFINGACLVAAGEIDGAWHPPKSMHGNMTWSQPFVGWLAHYGNTMLGWHERAKMLLKAYAAAMVKTDEKTDYSVDETGTMPADTSRFYGKGYIAEDQSFYNMQTQFFHQMIEEWRFSGDKEFANVLRDALRLHLEREDACFDPEGTGLYASVINTWPTDSVSYADAGAVEETCYVYAAYRALAELTEGEESAYCTAKAQAIKKAFFEQLWIPEKGYPGVYRDRGGRLHEDAWIYSSFLPVECELTDPLQTAQALWYPEWAFRRGEDGGFWFSNWTPGIWSVREDAMGENMQEASACLKGGKTAFALNILSSAAYTCFNADSEIVGDLMHPTNEASSMYSKAVVKELFGYQPDYPHGRVTIAPKLPFAWDHASMKLKDVCIDWKRNGIRVKLSRKANLTIKLRLYSDELRAVEGAAAWHLEPVIGGQIVVIELPACGECDVRLKLGVPRAFRAPVELSAVPADIGAEMYINPQGIGPQTHGEHMLFRKEADGSLTEMRLHLGEDPAVAEVREKQKAAVPKDAAYSEVELTEQFNASVADIFKQRYLSPRPQKGCCAQIGYDGFSLWTFPKWGIVPTPMKLERTGEIATAEGVPLRVSDGAQNIAFASRWDNYPNDIEFPVGQAGRMAALLVAGSTNPMQCGIENARLTFVYEDGAEDVLPLVNPKNYISLCPYPPRATSTGTGINRSDVFNPIDEDLMVGFTSEIVSLGENLRALAFKWPLRSNCALKAIRLTACSNDIVVGLMAATIVQ